MIGMIAQPPMKAKKRRMTMSAVRKMGCYQKPLNSQRRACKSRFSKDIR